MDDIKETVRISGERLCRAVATLTTRICDVSLTDISDAHKELNIVLPLLLTEGILSKVDSVWKASIGVVMKLTMHAGTAIRPHMADLICCMLESLSSLEDQGLNYIELHSKCSPMWETLDLCIRVVDAESLNTLIPRLAHLVRSGVGPIPGLKMIKVFPTYLKNYGKNIPVGNESPLTWYLGEIVSLICEACHHHHRQVKENLPRLYEQVIKAFGNPDFLNMVFPLLLDMTKSAPWNLASNLWPVILQKQVMTSSRSSFICCNSFYSLDSL